jgi:cytochrome b involved in lipid metabolism
MVDSNSLADCGDLQQKNIETTRFTIEEVAKHNNERDCWLTIYDGVYDVSSFVKEHPGMLLFIKEEPL